MEENLELIKQFYTAFQNLDAEKMAACYHPSIQFHDPVFKTLHGSDAGDMWRMLIQRGGANLKITFSNISADDHTAKADWEAFYLFSKTNRKVHNKIKATFHFQDGKIIQHSDYFNFWKWSRMALGVPGIFLGWSSILNKKVSDESRKALKNFQKRNAK